MAKRDRWANLNFKRAMRTLANATGVPQPQTIQPSWTGTHQRRLQAYALLRSYINNESSEFRINSGMEVAENLREYGDAELIADQLLAAILGDTQTITVPGAAEARENSENNVLIVFEEYLREWAEKESFTIKLAEAENNAITLGDGVYALGWDPDKHRARLRVYPPDMYFPVLDPEDDNDFPSRVHIAYEFIKHRKNEAPKNMVRRITWELIEGICYYSDATWDVLEVQQYSFNLTEPGVDSFDISKAKFLAQDRLAMTSIDFLPVIHIANSVAGSEHYGKSSLSGILAIFDDMQNTDTDLQKAAVTAATPIIGISGATIDQTRSNYGPGEYWSLGEDGKITAIDTSNSLDALLKLSDSLAKRLSSNSRIPEALLGKVDPTKAPSGLAISLTYSPLTNLVGQKRPLRDFKYSLLFKFVLSFAVAAKNAGDTHESLSNLPSSLTDLKRAPKLVFGSYLPSDVTETITNVVTLLQNKAISSETALAMLQQIGVPIANIQEELSRLIKADLAGAKLLFEASGGDTKAVGDRLGITIVPPVAPISTVTTNNSLATLPGN